MKHRPHGGTQSLPREQVKFRGSCTNLAGLAHHRGLMSSDSLYQGPLRTRPQGDTISQVPGPQIPWVLSTCGNERDEVMVFSRVLGENAYVARRNPLVNRGILTSWNKDRWPQNYLLRQWVATGVLFEHAGCSSWR